MLSNYQTGYAVHACVLAFFCSYCMALFLLPSRNDLAKSILSRSFPLAQCRHISIMTYT